MSGVYWLYAVSPPTFKSDTAAYRAYFSSIARSWFDGNCIGEQFRLVSFWLGQDGHEADLRQEACYNLWQKHLEEGLTRLDYRDFEAQFCACHAVSTPPSTKPTQEP